MPEIVFLPDHVSVKVSAGTSIQEAGRSAGLLLDAPCGGHGLCGKCKVRVGKQEVLACQYQVEEDVTVILPEAPKSTGILANGMESGFAVFPVIKNPVREKLSDYFIDMTGGVLLTVPDIAGFIGADTMGCVLSTGMYKEDKITLMIDIGTNGEMVLGNKDRMVACSTAAGPALEGGRISCGMRGGPGAVDHIWMEDDTVCSSVIGWRETLKKGSSVPDVEVQGLCGSGLIDAIAVMLDLDEQVDRVILCGAFGTYMNAKSAARIGLIPEPLLSKVIAGGNAAGMGCRQITMDQKLFALTGKLVQKIEPLDLASLPQFQRTFAKQMAFSEV